jgi:hypothetical protein
MGWIDGVVRDSSGTPLSGIEIIYDYVDLGWMLDGKKSVYSDTTGYFIIKEMARRVDLSYHMGEGEDPYASQRQIWPGDTTSVKLTVSQINRLPGSAHGREPDGCMLYQNYPNPFNASTRFRFMLMRQAKIEFNIYDVRGHWVCTLVDGEKSAGIHEVTWNALNYASGLYYGLLKAGKGIQYVKFLLIK